MQVYIWPLSHEAHVSTMFMDPEFVLLETRFSLDMGVCMAVTTHMGASNKISDNALDYFYLTVKAS